MRGCGETSRQRRLHARRGSRTPHGFSPISLNAFSKRFAQVCSRKQRLRPHYAKTLDTWAANLESKKDKAIEITSEEVYERFMKYLTGCADLFRQGYTDVCQFTCEKG